MQTSDISSMLRYLTSPPLVMGSTADLCIFVHTDVRDEKLMPAEDCPVTEIVLALVDPE